MNKIPTYIVILSTAILLFGGLAIFSLFSEAADENTLQEISEAPLALFLGVGIPIYILEALCFTVITIELSAKFARSTWLGAILGILAYGVLYHWSNGAFSILISSWIVLVLNSSYIILRKRSRKIGIASTIAHKLAFFFFAVYSIYM
ncbi:hypothetical protein [Kangiella marina]|uniref:CPBP family intramembrane metalloprotease n=1 Tax=Kangiella marina TaxID=1079178 RepID=A0ABP8IE74_9GAMM